MLSLLLFSSMICLYYIKPPILIKTLMWICLFETNYTYITGNINSIAFITSEKSLCTTASYMREHSLNGLVWCIPVSVNTWEHKLSRYLRAYTS